QWAELWHWPDRANETELRQLLDLLCVGNRGHEPQAARLVVLADVQLDTCLLCESQELVFPVRIQIRVVMKHDLKQLGLARNLAKHTIFGGHRTDRLNLLQLVY